LRLQKRKYAVFASYVCAHCRSIGLFYGICGRNSSKTVPSAFAVVKPRMISFASGYFCLFYGKGLDFFERIAHTYAMVNINRRYTSWNLPFPRRGILFLVFALIACGGIFAQQLTVAVSRFDIIGEISKEDADGVTDLFMSELVTNGAVRVVDRNSFDRILQEMKFQASDWADKNKVAQLGKALNADSIIRGMVMTLGNKTVISSTILDINTAQILAASSTSMNAMNEVFTKLPVLVKEMSTNLQQLKTRNANLTVAISPFDIRSGLSADEANAIIEMFIAELAADGTVKVVDRNSFDKIVQEMRFQVSDWSDDNKVAQLGRALNANSIVRGTMMSFAGQIVITATIMDINTAQQLLSSTLRMETVGEVFDKLPTFVYDMTHPVYEVGQKGPAGGLIFYDKGIYSDGWRYLEAAPADIGYYDTVGHPRDGNWATIYEIVWNQRVADVPGTKVEVGTGKQNTAIIVKFGGTAASYCVRYDFGGFKDWFLPSIDELALMYQNLYQRGLGNFVKDRSYWSSSFDQVKSSYSQTSRYDYAYAMFLSFSGNGSKGESGSVTSGLKVRAIRQF